MPWRADRGVVKDSLDIQPVDADFKFVTCNRRQCRFFCINVRSAVGVARHLKERVFLERDVVETDALEAIVYAVSAVLIRLEFKEHIDG